MFPLKAFPATTNQSTILVAAKALLAAVDWRQPRAAAGRMYAAAARTCSSNRGQYR